MISPQHRCRVSCAWLIATLALASCASRPPVREADEAVRQLRADYLHANPGGQFNPIIQRGEVALGMRFDDVVASWGIPDARERKGDGVHERWTYTVTDAWNGDWVRYDLLFEQKALASWETMRNVASSHPLSGRDAAPLLPPLPAANSAGLTGGAVTRR
jgi:hypothetical protein